MPLLPRKRPASAGWMTGGQAKGVTRSGSPNLCQECLAKPARVTARVKGKNVWMCHDCADDIS